MRFWLRGCPRCQGDVYEERGLGSVDMVCIQCGHILTVVQETALRSNWKEVAARERAAATGVAA